MPSCVPQSPGLAPPPLALVALRCVYAVGMAERSDADEPAGVSAARRSSPTTSQPRCASGLLGESICVFRVRKTVRPSVLRINAQALDRIDVRAEFTPFRRRREPKSDNRFLAQFGPPEQLPRGSRHGRRNNVGPWARGCQRCRGMLRRCRRRWQRARNGLLLRNDLRLS